MPVLTQEKERKARRRGKALQNEEASAPYPAEEEEMEGSGASGNEEEAPEDGEGTQNASHVCKILHDLLILEKSSPFRIGLKNHYLSIEYLYR